MLSKSLRFSEDILVFIERFSFQLHRLLCGCWVFLLVNAENQYSLNKLPGSFDYVLLLINQLILLFFNNTPLFPVLILINSLNDSYPRRLNPQKPSKIIILNKLLRAQINSYFLLNITERRRSNQQKST